MRRRLTGVTAAALWAVPLLSPIADPPTGGTASSGAAAVSAPTTGVGAAAPATAAAPAADAATAAPTIAVPATASFAVRVGRVTVPLRVMALAVLPGASVDIRREGTAGGGLTATSEGGRLRRAGDDGWSWSAPERPGFHSVTIVSAEPRDSIRVTFMVVRPASAVRDGHLNGYRIGRYRPRPASMSGVYEPPPGFVEARPEDWNLQVSPNFRLGQFLCKQAGDPRYLLISPRLLIKLEALLAAVNEAGRPTPTLTVMSGFRTPAYNRAIGNTTDFSRHLWGDAADVFVDVDGDGRMDDLDGDGRSGLGDARWLAGVVEEMMARKGPGATPGGLSVYRSNAAHGPFVHVDARGYRARW